MARDAVDQLVLGTADRNDILFSVPHSHAAFGQSYQSYCEELEQWLRNFYEAKLTAVNFGYILIQETPLANTVPIISARFIIPIARFMKQSKTISTAGATE